jgi:hypothetical protein
LLDGTKSSGAHDEQLDHGNATRLRFEKANPFCQENDVAKKKRKYSPSASSDVKNEMHRYKRGTAKSGKGGKGGKVKSRKQAIAIGLSIARKKGKKVPKKKVS